MSGSYETVQRAEALVADTLRAIGGEPPAFLEADAPLLATGELSADNSSAFYLIGLIGGKNVGKSALVNALVGREITLRTGYGAGTETVIAYVHASREPAVRALLEREAPGAYEMVAHQDDRLARQVLLDLPDIDSHYEAHVALTRRMLRHMLYPLWIQSVEKYADARPRELLLKVTAGNAPENFIFCLSKADQLTEREGNGALEVLRDDYASRLKKTLGLKGPPRVWAVSAMQPDRWDLPALKQQLSREKPLEMVHVSRQLAARQRAVSMLQWFDQQDIPGREERLVRLLERAQEEVTRRVGTVLIERTAPRVLEDSGLRFAMMRGLLSHRVRRWPMLSVLHQVLEPAVSLMSRAMGHTAGRIEDAELFISRQMNLDGGAESLQAAFAWLQQGEPRMSELYVHRRLWEREPAEAACSELQERLGNFVRNLYGRMRERLDGWRARLLWPIRWLLTVGAALWFIVAQPLLEAWLEKGEEWKVSLVWVRMFSVPYLLQSVLFLLVYFSLLWLLLRWGTSRRVERRLEACKTVDPTDPTMSLTGQVFEWLTQLLSPIVQDRDRLAALTRRAEALRADMAKREE